MTSLDVLADLAFGEIPDDPPAMGDLVSSTVSLAGSNSAPAMAPPDAPPAIENVAPRYFPPAGLNPLSARGVTPPSQATPAGPNPPTMVKTTPNQATEAGEGEARPAMGDVRPNDLSLAGPILADPVLGMHADTVDDLETARIAAENRLRAFTDTSERGHGLTETHPEIRRLNRTVDDLKKLEHQAVLDLKRAMRHHPLGGWVKATLGVGEKQAARLLASIRDPYWHDVQQRPRRLYELYSYTGMHTVEACYPGGQKTVVSHEANAVRVAPTRRRGERANWNAQARQRVWLIAESCVKCHNSPYRAVYDTTRAHYADAVHDVPCIRCGPSGHPAAVGSPLSAGHQHARAMRAMCKAILRDLWREARNLHHPTDNEGANA